MVQADQEGLEAVSTDLTPEIMVLPAHQWVDRDRIIDQAVVYQDPGIHLVTVHPEAEDPEA